MPVIKRSSGLLLKNNFVLDKNYEYVSKKDAGKFAVYYLKQRV
jgi:hypothetical protein